MILYFFVKIYSRGSIFFRSKFEILVKSVKSQNFCEKMESEIREKQMSVQTKLVHGLTYTRTEIKGVFVDSHGNNWQREEIFRCIRGMSGVYYTVVITKNGLRMFQHETTSFDQGEATG